MLVAAAVVSAGVSSIPAARAQGSPQQLPGVVVTQPQPPQQASPIVMTYPPAAVSTTTSTATPASAAPISTTTSSQQQAQPVPAPAAKPKARPRTEAAPKPPIGSPSAPLSGNPSDGRAITFVNDEPITGYQLEARARLMMLGTNISEKASDNMKRLIQSEETNQRWRKLIEETVKQNPGKTQQQMMAIIEQKKAGFAAGLREQAISGARASIMPTLRKQAKEELIEEQLKLQEAKRLNIVIEDKDVDAIVKSLADRNKMDEKQFAAHLKSIGVDIGAMRERFKATLSWNEVVRRTFGNQVTVSEREIERFASQGSKGEEQIELKLSRILLPLPAKVDQRTMADTLDKAERIRAAHKSCKGMAAEAVQHGGKYEDMGYRPASSFKDPLLTMLVSAQENEMVAPNVTPAGVELLAVCKRSVMTATEQKRQEVMSDLRQREFEVRARGLLADLKGRAEIVDREKQASR